MVFISLDPAAASDLITLRETVFFPVCDGYDQLASKIMVTSSLVLAVPTVQDIL